MNRVSSTATRRGDRVSKRIPEGNGPFLEAGFGLEAIKRG